MAVLYDPTSALTTDWRTYFTEHRDDLFLFPTVEGNVELTGAWMLLNIMLTMPLIRRQRPISRDKHMHLEGIYNSTVHATVLTRISRSLEEYGYTREELGFDMIKTVSDAHNMNYTHICRWIQTIDIFKIAQTILQPGVEEVCTMDYGDTEDGNIHRMETLFKDRCKDVKAIFTNPNTPNNAFYAPLICNALKEGQFYQFVLSAGPRTDTDDQHFLRPVLGSFLSGMIDEVDLALESRSAAKATHYNKTQMPNTQYQNRKIHIQNSSIRFLYKGDCGSQVYMTFTPTEKTVKYYLGKFYLGADGQLTELTRERFPEVIGKTVQMRDTIPCRYTDGYCEVCGGTITRSFSLTGNVGFLSNVNTGAPVAQQVLSTKHLISTTAAEYEIPSDLQQLLIANTNDIFLRPAWRNQKNMLVLGFQRRDLEKLNDLQYFNRANDLQAAYFTDIKFLYTGILREDGTIDTTTPRVPMGSDGKTYPHLSPEILAVIRDYPEDLFPHDGKMWIKLEHVDVNLPIMQCTVANKSIKKFVDDFSNLVTKNVERYTSANALMHDLCSLTWERVDPHVTHLSCLVRACLVTSKKDAHIPLVEDPDNVMFGNLMRNIPMRSIGGLFAFERYNLASNKPTTYITEKRHSEYDEFMGYADTIARDMEWPVKTGSPLIVEGVD